MALSINLEKNLAEGIHKIKCKTEIKKCETCVELTAKLTESSVVYTNVSVIYKWLKNIHIFCVATGITKKILIKFSYKFSSHDNNRFISFS